MTYLDTWSITNIQVYEFNFMSHGYIWLSGRINLPSSLPLGKMKHEYIYTCTVPIGQMLTKFNKNFPESFSLKWR